MMRFPRCTLRLAMFLVALVAVTLGAGGECLRRRSSFLSLASTYAAESCDGRIVPLARRATISEAELAAYDERRLAWEGYHAGLVAKCARAARYPWLSVEADPPEPERVQSALGSNAMPPAKSRWTAKDLLIVIALLALIFYSGVLFVKSYIWMVRAGW